MINRRAFFYIAIVLMTYSHSLVAEQNNSDQIKVEVAILIDGSLAMLKKDPGNLRALILKAMPEALPSNALASVWVFNTTAQLLVPVGPANERWGKAVIEAIPKLALKGGYKNLGEALEVVTAQWAEPTNSVRKIILVTDGMIKVSDNRQENEEAKAHVLYSLTQNFKKNNIKLHIMGISDVMDQIFLEELAIKTEGSYHKVEPGENLTWLLLKIFDRSPQLDPNQLEQLSVKSIPVEENHFTIEQPSDEINLLVFREKANDMLAIKNPKGKVLDKSIIGKKISWQTEGLLDFITIANPRVGAWTIVGNLDKQNKFIVLNNLEIESSQLPDDVFVGESFMFTACLANNGELIKNEDFLKSIKFEVVIEPTSTAIAPFYFNNKSNRKGNYSLQLGPFEKAVKEAIVMKTNFVGKTFRRNKQQNIRVLPVPIKVQTAIKVDKNKQQTINIVAVPDEHVLDLKNINMSVRIVDNTGVAATYNMQRTGKLWQLNLAPQAGISEYTVVTQVLGETTLGRYVELTTDPLRVMVPEVTLPDPVVVTIKETESKLSKKDRTISDDNKLPEFSLTSMILTLIGILVGNGAILAGLIFGFRKVKATQQIKLAAVMTKLEQEHIG